MFVIVYINFSVASKPLHCEFWFLDHILVYVNWLTYDSRLLPCPSLGLLHQFVYWSLLNLFLHFSCVICFRGMCICTPSPFWAFSASDSLTSLIIIILHETFVFFFFFFLINKGKYTNQEEETPKTSALKVYRWYTHRLPLESIQSKKLTREEGLKTKEILTQDQRLHTKEYFNLWSESSSFLKANLFLSF